MNTLILSMDNLITGEENLKLMSNFNKAFTIIFAIEMGLKIFALGIFDYIRDNMNLFDGIIVILSIIELTILNQDGGNSAISAFR